MNQARRYKEVREKAGLSLRALAREMGVSPTFVSMVESEEYGTNYCMSTMMKFLRAVKADSTIAQELLEQFLAYHRSEIEVIQRFIKEMEANGSEAT